MEVQENYHCLSWEPHEILWGKYEVLYLKIGSICDYNCPLNS